MPNGSRSATAGDRSGKVRARYVCQTPIMFRVKDGKVVDPSEINDPSKDVVVYESASGPVLVEGEQATINHWVDKGSDHFFSWSEGGLGAETILADDRRSASQFLWAPQPEDENAYVTKQFPDGTTRPAGIPIDVFSCLAREGFERLREKYPHPFVLEGLTPVPVESVGAHLGLRMNNCGRGEAKLIKTAPDRFHNDWGWVPFEVYLPAASSDVAYLSYERSLLGRELVWQVELRDHEKDKNQRVFHTRFGNVELYGSVVTSTRDSRVKSVLITGGIVGLENSMMSCWYEQ
jgi:hypothetical protein